MYLMKNCEIDVEAVLEKIKSSEFLEELSELAETFESVQDISYELNVVVYVNSDEKEEIFSFAPFLTCLKIGIYHCDDKFLVAYPLKEIADTCCILKDEFNAKIDKNLKSFGKMLNKLSTKEKFKKKNEEMHKNNSRFPELEKCFAIQNEPVQESDNIVVQPSKTESNLLCLNSGDKNQQLAELAKAKEIVLNLPSVDYKQQTIKNISFSKTGELKKLIAQALIENIFTENDLFQKFNNYQQS